MDDQPCMAKDGYSILRIKYDERGNQTEWACFDAEDRPALDKASGTHRIVQVCDERGKPTETRFIGVDEQLSPLSYGYAIIRQMYDERGNQSEWACFDARGQPTLDKSAGNHKFVQAFDERGKVTVKTPEQFMGLTREGAPRLHGTDHGSPVGFFLREISSIPNARIGFRPFAGSFSFLQSEPSYWDGPESRGIALLTKA